MFSTFNVCTRNGAPLRLMLVMLLVSLSVALTRPAAALGTAVPYTGQLLSGTTPLTGTYDLQFTLYNAATGGSTVGSTLTKTSVTVAGGVFYVELDFGSVYNGTTLYLQTAYRVHPTSGSPDYTLQSPRKLFSTSAYADYATASGTTKALQGFFVSATPPTSGQVLTWTASGNKWLPQTLPAAPTYTAGTGLALSGNQFSVATGGITNTLLGAGSVGPSKITSGAISGDKLALPLTASVSSGSDLFTITNSGAGRAIVGNSSSNTAVKGVGRNGVYGQGTNYGVQASGTNYGVYSTSPAVGVYGSGTGSSGVGVQGTGGSTGVSGSGTTYGLYGTGTDYGVYGTSTNYGVYGTSASGYGVYGYGSYGIVGSGTSLGVYGSGGTYGVYGIASSSDSTTTYGLYGSGGTYGVYGSGSSYGVYGFNSTNSAYGVLGGPSNSGAANGVIGESEAAGGNGILAIDKAESGYAIYAIGNASQASNRAGYFQGNVSISGNLTKSSGSFKIDHPLDPAHKYLYHSFVESPDMKNIYDGTITLGADGTAQVTLPDWFEALNQDFRYQLTAIGAPGPNLYIAQEIDGNQFAIAGGRPGTKVSWQVTGTRHDAWANAHRIPVEEDKPADEQGTYLHPKEFGLPASRGMNFAREQALPQRLPNPPKAAAPQSTP